MKLIVNKRSWWAGHSAETSGNKTKLYEIDDKHLGVGQTFLISSFIMDGKNDVADIELAIKIINKDDKKIKINVITNNLSINKQNKSYIKESANDKNFILNKIKMPNDVEELTKEHLKNIVFLTTNSMDAGTEYSIYLVD